MHLHPGWLCVLLLATPVVCVVGLSGAVQFADFPRFWALALLAAGTPAYVVVALKAVPRPEGASVSDDVVGETAPSPQLDSSSGQLR